MDYGKRPYALDKGYIEYMDQITDQYVKSIDGIYPADFKQPYEHEDYYSMMYLFNEKQDYLGGAPPTLEDLGLGTAVEITTGITLGSGWVERRPLGDVGKRWRCLDLDSDGSVIVVGIYGGSLQMSATAGVSWEELRLFEGANWKCSSSDSDGSNLIVGVYSGRIYTSSNYGVNWTERQPSGEIEMWTGVCSSSDGSKLACCAADGRIYTSTDGGNSWTERQPAGDADKWWSSIACDSDMSNLIVCVGWRFQYDDRKGRLYTSSDSGVNWTERRPDGDADKWWISVASDSDGSNLVVASLSTMEKGEVFTSSDSGVNWTERKPGGEEVIYWTSMASNSTGSVLIAACDSTPLT